MMITGQMETTQVTTRTTVIPQYTKVVLSTMYLLMMRISMKKTKYRHVGFFLFIKKEDFFSFALRA